LRAADKGFDAAEELAKELILTLRITMFCVGAATLGGLRAAPLFPAEANARR
jgi:isopentenyl diphosphate isomerase/L-lactate dehydrogenase-like FMN-dependent dehydrogenase